MGKGGGERRGEILGLALPITEASGRSSHSHTPYLIQYMFRIFFLLNTCVVKVYIYTCSVSLNVSSYKGTAAGRGRGGGGRGEGDSMA